MAYHKFDFSNPEVWRYFGGVMNYSSGSEEEAEIAEMVCENMEEANNVPGQVGFYGKEYAVSNLCRDDSRFASINTCDHCGTFFKYGAIFKNKDTGEHCVVGHVCATNTLNLTANEFMNKKMRRTVEMIKTKLKGDAFLASLMSNRRDILSWSHYIVTDIRKRFRQYGYCSVKQWSLVKKIVAEDIEREAAKVMEAKHAKPVIEGKGMVIEGVVLYTKWQDGYTYNSPQTLKLMIRDVRGFKVWGSCPSSIEEQVYGSEKCIIKLVANVEASRDDPTFGFFKRPRKAKLLEVK